MSHPDLSHLRHTSKRLTPQRRLIWEELHGSRQHLTAEELHQQVSRRMPEVSRPTVYRTLVDLVNADQVREIAVAHGPSRYEAICSDDRHSDLVCNVCGSIEKVRDPAFDTALQAAQRRHAFSEVHLVLYGTCRHCRAEET
jgi:Fur family ferric uptake transcriptional regulator